jgi:hypothetical protein
MPGGAGVLAQVEIEPVTCCTHVTIRSQVTLQNKCHLPLQVLFSLPQVTSYVQWMPRAIVSESRHA